jgi:uncharacterized MAPEG superfamily protein
MPAPFTFVIGVILAAALLPFVMLLLTGIPAKGGLTRWGPGWDNRHVRDSIARLGGWRQRAHFAQQNGHEAFPPFAAAVILAHLARASGDEVKLLAGAFLGFRVLYGIFYVADRGVARSAAWWGGALAVLGLFLAALRAA